MELRETPSTFKTFLLYKGFHMIYTHRSKIKPMRIALWNANGLAQHKFELELFLTQQQIDVMLISETHFTDKNYLKIHGYNFYHTQHPSGKAHGGTGNIIKSSIKHYELPSFQKDYLQATSVAIEDRHGTITTSAVYCPPRHSIAKENFDSLFDALGNRFLAGGDYNAKHIQWGSRLVTARGKNLLQSITTNNLNYLTTYEPPYWPTDTNKIPDLHDFFITKNISPRHVQINSSTELSSDHSPVIATVSSGIIENPPNGLIHIQLINWLLFREVFNNSTSASISLKTMEDIESGWIVNLLANYLSNVFKPHSSNIAPEITEYLHSLFQMSPPIKPFIFLEVTELIHRLYLGKASGHDQITNKAIKELSVTEIALISSIFNAILRVEYHPKTWKTSQITLIPKPGKPIHETSSYRPISLLPTLSKLFEKLVTNRFLPLLEDLKTLPDHQFGFRKHIL